MDAVAMLHKYDALTGELQAMLDAAHERERVNLQTIRELQVALRVQEQDLREANARIRAYERGANG